MEFEIPGQNEKWGPCSKIIKDLRIVIAGH